MADVGLLMVYWNDPSDDSTLLNVSATQVDGFPRKAELIERYAKQSGRDVSQVDYYVALGYWKLACILEGVYARYAAGVMGNSDPSAFEGFKLNVERLAASARAAVDRLP
jgi:aminoglycoside phosphotransferase (APT) family kinase protein